MSPEKAVKLLNEYFSAMHDVIEKHNGQIINYIGDSVMVVFGPKNGHEFFRRCALDAKTLNEKSKWDVKRIFKVF